MDLSVCLSDYGNIKNSYCSSIYNNKVYTANCIQLQGLISHLLSKLTLKFNKNMQKNPRTIEQRQPDMWIEYIVIAGS